MSHWHSSQYVTADASAAPSTPTLAVADQADGTGATATVTNSDAGSTNTIYTQAFSGALGTGTWTNSGSRSGDGTVDLSLSTGHYLAICISTDTGGATSSTPVYFVVTSAATESVWYQCLVAAQARVQAATLSGIANSSVIVKKQELHRLIRQPDGITLPAVIITPLRETMRPTEGVTTFDDVGYGVLVTTVAADNQEATVAANLNRDTLWRQQIARAFRNQRLSGVDEIINAWVEPADFIQLPAWASGLLVSSLAVRFVSRETRGL